jgi:hypothetical protein
MGMDEKEQAEVQGFFDEVKEAGYESPFDLRWIPNIIYRAFKAGEAKGFQRGRESEPGKE